MAAPDAKLLRPIRSFVRRQGRMTVGQERALQSLAARYCLDPHGSHDYTEVFGRQAPLIVEIGFGNGEALAQMAADNPGYDYLGIEVHRPGIGQLLLRLEQQGISNVRIFCDDAVQILERQIADAGLAAVHLFFPDPWPKSKHHKRRIVQPAFVALVARKLASGGYFHTATDWAEYAEAIKATLDASSDFQKTEPIEGLTPPPTRRPQTKFERRGVNLGHQVWDLVYWKAAFARQL